jgi:hypothetical protein
MGTWVRRLPAGSRVLQFDHRHIDNLSYVKLDYFFKNIKHECVPTWHSRRGW